MSSRTQSLCKAKYLWGVVLVFLTFLVIHRWPETEGSVVLGKYTPLVGGAAMTRHRTTAKRCEEPAPKDEDLQFMSQSGEDKQLMAWFHGLCGGTYVEMGGLDGKWLSNSFVFNQGFGWKGVLIEANPVAFKEMQTNRPQEIALINAAVCDEPKTVHWVDTGVGDRSAVGGIFEFADTAFANRWWTGQPHKKIPIQCVPFGQLLDQHSPTQYFDFLSLDVEGSEYVALSKLDFNRYAFGIIFVETGDLRKSLIVRSHLEVNGYTFLMSNQQNDWFYNNQFGYIYGEFAHPALSK